MGCICRFLPRVPCETRCDLRCSQTSRDYLCSVGCCISRRKQSQLRPYLVSSLFVSFLLHLSVCHLQYSLTGFEWLIFTEDGSSNSSFAFLSSFQSNLLADGLKNQVGWGHVWNRYAGPLSCPKQPNQCAFTPLAPPGWWDGLWQSPIPRDTRRLAAFGIELSGFGTVNEDRFHAFCSAKKEYLNTVTIV